MMIGVLSPQVYLKLTIKNFIDLIFKGAKDFEVGGLVEVAHYHFLFIKI